jgi:hypothetical protein
VASAFERIRYFKIKRIKISRIKGNKKRSIRKVWVSRREKNRLISVTEEETPMAIHK